MDKSLKFNSDREVLNTLRENYSQYRGVISKRDPTHESTAIEHDAIIYLTTEWDYSYEG